jgi:hypothetical protein
VVDVVRWRIAIRRGNVRFACAHTIELDFSGGLVWDSYGVVVTLSSAGEEAKTILGVTAACVAIF